MLRTARSWRHPGAVFEADSIVACFTKRTDKLVALALRPNRLKSQDLWDIVWLNRQGITLPVQLVLKKAIDRRQDLTRFLEQLQQRTMQLRTDPAVRKDFLAEMRRFLPPAVFGENLETDEFWLYLVGLITDEGEKVQKEALWKP